MTDQLLFFEPMPGFEDLAIDPQRTSTEHAEPKTIDGRSFIARDWREKRVMMETGYRIEPRDCPPIRNIARYGYQYFSAGHTNIKVNAERRKRYTQSHQASYGLYTHSGDPCKVTDSTFFSSWIGNSDYIKITSGLRVYCRVGYGLYQTSLPCDQRGLGVVSAIEFGNSDGKFTIAGSKYFRTELNLVCKPEASEITLQRGEPMGVFFPVVPTTKFDVRRIDDDNSAVKS
jgi:hypothetical protein